LAFIARVGNHVVGIEKNLMAKKRLPIGQPFDILQDES